VERGVLPDLLMIGANQNAQGILQDESIGALQAAGMGLLSKRNADGDEGKEKITDARHEEVYLAVANAAEIRALDERLLAILPVDDLVRRRWIQSVPQYLREARSGGRWVWLTKEERRQICW